MLSNDTNRAVAPPQIAILSTTITNQSTLQPTPANNQQPPTKTINTEWRNTISVSNTQQNNDDTA